MPGFTKRDYIVAGLIIFSVVSGWFLLIAMLMGLTDPGMAISVVVVLSFIVFIVLKRKNRPNVKK